MTARYVWVCLGVSLLLLSTGTAMGQTSPVRCTRMNLTTQNAYTLPVLSPVVEERIVGTPVPEGEVGSRVHVWLRVLQYSGHSDDRIEFFYNGVSLPEPEPPIFGNTGWQHLVFDVPSGESRPFEIRAITRTDNNRPTLILVGAIQLSDEALSTGPTEPDTLSGFAGLSDLATAGFEFPIIQRVTNPAEIGVPTPDEDDATIAQRYIARLGGLGAPRIAASLRYDDLTPVPEGEEEGEPEEGEPAEGEPVEGELVTPPTPITETVQLFFGNHAFRAPIPLSQIPLGYPVPTSAWETGECWRITDYIPQHLLNTPQRPIVQVNIDPATTFSRLIVDDFALTYITPALEREFPELVGLGNIIENGDFERGTYPFIIESPLGQTNCARITDVVRDIDDACNGNAAAVFDRIALRTPYVAYCVADAYVGRGQVGTLTIYGLNLEGLDAVLLVPETYANPAGIAAEHYVVLTSSSGITYEGDLERVSYGFRFDQPFNPDVNNTPICTDGRATFLYILEGALEGEALGACSTVIDTVLPVLVVADIPGTDASQGEPSISNTNRVYPDFGRGPYPATWVPGFDVPGLTPKNAQSFAAPDGDMHVYLNGGSRQDVHYSAALFPSDDLAFTVSAQFVDPYPVDAGGNVFIVERAGFLPAPVAMDNPFSGGAPGSIWWQRLQSPPGVYAVPTVGFIEPSYEVQVVWTAGAEYHPWEKWGTHFRFAARDRAGNELDAARYNSITVYWLHRTRAVFASPIDSAFGPVDVCARLARGFPTLTGAVSACSPLFKYTLYRSVGGNLTRLAVSGWERTCLTQNTLLSGAPLLQWLDANTGQDLCLSVVGADEAGNLQFVPIDFEAGTGLTRALLEASEIDFICWYHEAQIIPNHALDTEVRVQLFHERYENVLVRNYGPSTRAPLPLLADACDTRVNAFVWFRTIVPSTEAYSVARIIWKLYKDGALVARGVALPNWTGAVEPYLLLDDLLLGANTTPNPMDLVDFDASGFVTEARSLNRPAFLARPPDDATRLAAYNLDPCPTPPVGEAAGFMWRLGDEGNPPDLADMNAPSQRRREIRYTLTAQTVLDDGRMIDISPASARFSIYVREVDELHIRDEMPVREYSR